MKRLLFSVFLLGAFVAKAQISNSGFENWTSFGSYEVPDQWGTMNHATSHLNVFTVTKWNPGSPGAFFMKITSKMYGGNVMNGMAVYGKLDSTIMKPVSGYPYSQRPGAFTGQWQHMIWGTSQGSVCATLTKWNTTLNQRDTIAIAYEELVDMAMVWEAFSIDFNYLSADMPDSCMIVLKASGDTPDLNDYLWVDDLNFSGVAGIEDNLVLNDVSVYPVPASDKVTINFTSCKNKAIYICITNLMGQIVWNSTFNASEGANKIGIETKSLGTGLFFLNIEDNAKRICKKIVLD